jgi:hypothetical protein
VLENLHPGHKYFLGPTLVFYLAQRERPLCTGEIKIEGLLLTLPERFDGKSYDDSTPWHQLVSKVLKKVPYLSFACTELSSGAIFLQSA